MSVRQEQRRQVRVPKREDDLSLLCVGHLVALHAVAHVGSLAADGAATSLPALCKHASSSNRQRETTLKPMRDYLVDTYMVDPPRCGAKQIPASDLGEHSQCVAWQCDDPSSAYELLTKHVLGVGRNRTHSAFDLSVLRTDRPLILRRLLDSDGSLSHPVNIYCPTNGETFPRGSADDRTYYQSKDYAWWAVLGSCGSYVWQSEFCPAGDLTELEAKLFASGGFEGTSQELAVEYGQPIALMGPCLDALEQHSRRLNVTFSDEDGDVRCCRDRADVWVSITPRG